VDTPTGPNPAHNVPPSPPAVVQTQFSDNDWIRSGSFDGTTGHVASMAPMMNRSGRLLLYHGMMSPSAITAN
jgi:hypothetical protein